MKLRTALSLATLFLALFTVAAWSAPTSSHPSANLRNSAPDTQSIAGKITAVDDAEFSVDVPKNQRVEPMHFLIDENTKVEGKLAVGAQASVEYRSDDGKNVAVRVAVTPVSGMASH